MSEEEGELLCQICNDWSHNFGALVALHLKRAPRHLQDELMDMLQERSSCYGSGYSDHMERDTPLIEQMKSIMKQQEQRDPP